MRIFKTIKTALILLMIVVAHTGAMAQDSLVKKSDTAEIFIPPPPLDRIGQEEVPEIFLVVEHMPEFPGGQQAMAKYIAKHVEYPRKARRKGIEGKVIVQFIVTKTGEIDQVKVMNKVDPMLAEAAMNVIKEMPRWTPGTQKGQAVNIRFMIPITFKLED